MNTSDANLTPAEIHAADQVIKQALRSRVLPCYSPQERFALSILVAHHSQQQRARGKRSRGAAKERAEYRRNHVDLLLRYVIGKRYRKKPNTDATVMTIVGWLDDIGIEASVSQVRRDIHVAVNRGPLPDG